MIRHVEEQERQQRELLQRLVAQAGVGREGPPIVIPAQLPPAQSDVKATSDAIVGRVIRLRPGDSIQKAVDGARDGDTILLEPGRYDEQPILFRPALQRLTIRGVSDDPAQTVLNGGG